MAIDPTLLQSFIEAWHRIELPPGHAERLAEAVRPIDAATYPATHAMAFEAEPGTFRQVLEREED
jgi:hypothetical protein